MSQALTSRSSVALRASRPTRSSAARRSHAGVVVNARTSPSGDSSQPPASSREPSSSSRPMSGREWINMQPGICAPLGFFDPIGLTKSASFTVDEGKRLREAEITHGRVAMLAVVGWLVAEEFHPLFGGNIDGPAFVHFQKAVTVWPQWWRLVVLCIGLAEGWRLGRTYTDPQMSDEGQLQRRHTPGDLNFDPLHLYPSLPEETAKRFDMRTREINNGRLAMIAIAGFAAQEERDHTTILRGLLARGGTVDFNPPSAFPPYY